MFHPLYFALGVNQLSQQYFIQSHSESPKLISECKRLLLNTCLGLFFPKEGRGTRKDRIEMTIKATAVLLTSELYFLSSVDNSNLCKQFGP